MGKRSVGYFDKASGQKKDSNPLWRGIGCLMLVVVPLFSFGLGYVTLEAARTNGWPIPYQLLTAPVMPELFYLSPMLARFIGPIYTIQGLYGYILFTLIYILIVGGIISVIYAFIYRFVGPARYGPTDVPPDGRRAKKYTR